MTKTKLKIAGMHCASCAANVDDRLEELEGVKKSSTSFARGRAKVEFDESTVSVEAIHAAVAELGYEVEAS